MTVFTLSFTACSDDDETTDYAKEISGTYNGNIQVKIGSGTPVDVVDQNIYMTYKNESTIDLELKAFKFGPIDLGDIKIENVKVIHAGETSTIAGAGKIKKDVLDNGTEMDLDISVNGTITGKAAVITIGVANDMLTQMGVIKVNFTGTKK